MASGPSTRARARLRTHAEWCWAPALYALAVAALYHEIWSGAYGFGWDTIETYWADLAYLCNQLGRGEWPLWNPYDRGGLPAHADPQPGMYYPVHWLFAGVGVLLGGVSWWLIQIKMLLHHVLAGAGLHLFLRSRGISPAAAVCGGVAWIASAPMLIHKASNVLLPLVWTPLVWLAIDRLLARPTWRRGCALAAAVYLAGTAGSPPGFFYTLLMAVAYGGFRLVQAVLRARAHGGTPAAAPALPTLLWPLALAALVAVAMLLIAVLPGLALAEHSPRASRGLAYALSQPLSVPGTLVGFVQPHLGRQDAYAGILALMLALCAVAVQPLRDRGAPLFVAGAAAFFLCLSFGSATPMLGWLVEHVPGFGLFRIASRYKLLAAPMIAALAGYGAAAILDAPRAWRRPRIAALAATLAVLATAVVLALALAGTLTDILNGQPASSGLRAPRTPILLAALGAGLILLALYLPRRRAVLVVALMPLLLYVDPDHFVHTRGPIMEARPDPGRAAALDGLEHIDTRWRIYDEYMVEQRPGPRFGVRDFRGYPSGDPLDLVRYRDILRYAKKRPEILGDYNVRYVLHGPHHRNHLRANHLKRRPSAQAPAHFRRLDAHRDEARHPAPLVAWYGAVRVAERAAQVLDLMRAAQAPDGARTYAVLEREQAARLQRAGEGAGSAPDDIVETLAAATPVPSIAGELRHYDVDRIELRVHAPAPGLVVLNETSYPGWTVAVDGRPATPLTANYLLRAVVVDAGDHDIVWTYEPPRQTLLAALWWLGALILAAAALAPGARRWWPRRTRPAGGDVRDASDGNDDSDAGDPTPPARPEERA